MTYHATACKIKGRLTFVFSDNCEYHARRKTREALNAAIPSTQNKPESQDNPFDVGWFNLTSDNGIITDQMAQTALAVLHQHGAISAQEARDAAHTFGIQPPLVQDDPRPTTPPSAPQKIIAYKSPGIKP